MEIDSEKEVQLIRFGERSYVLILEDAYEELLRQLDSFHSALEVQHTRVESSATIIQTLMEAKLTPEQVDEIMEAPSRGRRLSLLRQFRKLEQSELAKKSDVNQATISKLENDKLENPSFENLHRILEALGVPDIVSYPLLKAPSFAEKSKVEV